MHKIMNDAWWNCWIDIDCFCFFGVKTSKSGSFVHVVKRSPEQVLKGILFSLQSKILGVRQQATHIAVLDMLGRYPLSALT
jgi:hypothetical protein